MLPAMREPEIVKNSKLEHIRSEIDALDEQLVELLNRRARLALDIASVKQQVMYHPEREARVLDRVKALNKGPMPDGEITRLVREIMSACLALAGAVEYRLPGTGGDLHADGCPEAFRTIGPVEAVG